MEARADAAPARAAPACACDSHIHVYDRRFAFAGPMVDGATAATTAACRRDSARPARWW